MKYRTTNTLFAVLFVCFVIPAAVAAEKVAEQASPGASETPSEIERQRASKHEIYEFTPANSAYRLFVLKRQLEYVRNRIRTASEWIPRLAIEKPKIDPEKVLSELRAQQATLETRAREYEERVAADKTIFPEPFVQDTTILQKHQHALSDVFAQAVQSKQAALTPPCPEDFYLYSAVSATEFREYKTTQRPEGTNTDSDWRLARGLSESPILEATTLRFDANAFPIPGLVLDYPNTIQTAGLLKFDFPVAPCNVVIEWNATVNIDFILGAIISGEHDALMVDLVIREEPASTNFPDAGLDDPGFQWHDWGELDFYDPDAANWQRRTKRERLSGQFQVGAGIRSSLIIGPSLMLFGDSEWASVGRMDNPNDDGAFFFHGMGEDCYYGLPCGPQDLSIEFLMRPR